MEFNAFRSTITCILCNLADFTSPLPLPSFSPLFSPNEIIYGGTCNQTSLSRTRCDWFKTVNYKSIVVGTCKITSKKPLEHISVFETPKLNCTMFECMDFHGLFIVNAYTDAYQMIWRLIYFIYE